MPSLWKFGGLTPLRLIKLATHKVGEDELSTRSASLSYYFLLALFPLFNRFGWFWGAGFSGGAVDSMHFELAEETIRKMA